MKTSFLPKTSKIIVRISARRPHKEYLLMFNGQFNLLSQLLILQIWSISALRTESGLKVSKNRNDFMKTSFLSKTSEIIVRISARRPHKEYLLMFNGQFNLLSQLLILQIWDISALRTQSGLKVSNNRNDFMKTSFLPKPNKIIVRISTHYISWQLFRWFLGEMLSSWNYFGFYWPLTKSNLLGSLKHRDWNLELSIQSLFISKNQFLNQTYNVWNF